MEFLSSLLLVLASFGLGALLVYLRQRNLQREHSLLEERLRQHVGQLDENRTKLQEAQSEQLRHTSVIAELKTENRHLHEKLTEEASRLEAINQKLQKDFELLAQRVLDEKAQKFSEQNRNQVGDLLRPLGEKIREFQQKVEQSNADDIKRSSALETQLRQLKELNQQITSEAKSLTRALRGDSKSQGNWGEMQLSSILELAGLQKGIHYQKEQSHRSENGSQQRLDYIINLPEGRHLILDSKVSLTAYSRYFDCEDEGEKAQHLREHLLSLHAHIKGLGERNYQNLYEINSPDYVMMFIANEPALTVALQEDPDLYEKALQKNIALVSSTTLLATLRTVSYIWQQDNRQKNAEEIATQSGALYDKFVGFAEELSKLGKQLETAQGTYDKAFSKLSSGKGNLVRRAEQLRELGAKTSKTMDQKLLDED